MNKYSIVIEETVSGTFEIQAPDADTAMEIAKKQYSEGTLVLSPGEVQFKQMSVLNHEKGVAEWHEF